MTVDGAIVRELGTKVDPERAVIRIDGHPIAAETHRYVMLHKPPGYLSGADPKAEYPSWEELVPVPERLVSVGRLDQDSEGLLLLTNDGELVNRLTHPRYQHPKTYLVLVDGLPDPRKIRRLQHGIMLDDGPTAPAQVELLRETPRPFAQGPVRGTSWLKITLREGRKRQIRRMTGVLGHQARRVIRVSLGPLQLGDLRPGKWRDLTPAEIKQLRSVMSGGPDLPSPTVRERPQPERKARLLVPPIIAIDGPAASGKSTIGGLLAKELGYLYFDTGVMYRAITAAALERGVSPNDEPAMEVLAQQVKLDVLPPTVDDGRDVTVLADGVDITTRLRDRDVEKGVSPVSSFKGVREALTDQQRRIGEAGKIVMIGRDIGTVVLPHADLKIYLDAALGERARRRYRERVRRGEEAALDRVQEELKQRDIFDSTRTHAPLTVAPDAIIVDSTEMSIEQVMENVIGLVRRWGRMRQQQALARPLARPRRR